MRTRSNPWKRMSFGYCGYVRDDEPRTWIRIHEDHFVLVYVESEDDEEYEFCAAVTTASSVDELVAAAAQDYADTWEEKVPMVWVDEPTRHFDDFANQVHGYDIRRADGTTVRAWVEQEFVDRRVHRACW